MSFLEGYSLEAALLATVTAQRRSVIPVLRPAGTNWVIVQTLDLAFSVLFACSLSKGYPP